MRLTGSIVLYPPPPPPPPPPSRGLGSGDMFLCYYPNRSIGFGALLLLRGTGVAFLGGVGSRASWRGGSGAGLAGVLATDAYVGWGWVFGGAEA